MEEISHEGDTQCERLGSCETHYSDAHREDLSHREGMMKFFNLLASSYLQELEEHHDILRNEIISTTEGLPVWKRRDGLLLCHWFAPGNIEEHSLVLQKSNIDYHYSLLKFDRKFYNNVMVISHEESEKTPEDIEAVIALRFTERKRECKAMFLEHLTEMREIHDNMLLDCERQRREIHAMIASNSEPTGQYDPYGMEIDEQTGKYKLVRFFLPVVTEP